MFGTYRVTMKLKPFFLVFLLALSGVGTAGCAAIAVGAAAAGGTVAYVRGDLQTTFDHNLERVYEATLGAVDDFGFALISDRGDRTGGDLVARTGQDRRVKISMVPVGDELTEVSIRVGAFGDQDLSMRIHDAIRARL